ncbi:MAG: MarR family transcriptional regulator [Caldilineaceae bacterium]|nr:MarR family transcriptional regulator [Caldilineaceae bacterium]
MNDQPAAPVAGLEDHLGYWLRFVSNHVSGAFAQALQTKQVSVAEWVALRQLYEHQPMTPGELAALIGMTRGAISKVLMKLESKAWITRAIDEKDSRVQWITLTVTGHQILPELAQLADQNDAYFFGGLGHAEEQTLRKLLKKLVQIHQWHSVPVE